MKAAKTTRSRAFVGREISCPFPGNASGIPNKETNSMTHLGAELANAFAHCKGIAHRDIKPENVLMSHTSDVVKLADFGLAVEIQTSSPANLKRFCGTPMYVAPEIGNYFFYLN